MVSVTLVVAAHKAAQFPLDPMYKPVQAGAALANEGLSIQRDDNGENISDANRTYCELTVLYWAWKNVCSEAIGLNHYRRYFAGTAQPPYGRRGILAQDEAVELMYSYDVVLPRPRNYFIETAESHYRNAHYGEDLDRMRLIVDGIRPEYRKALETVLKGRELSLYNMLLMRREALHAYCEWLFPLLDLFVHEVDLTDRNSRQRRVAGFLGERLLNVWILHHAGDLRIARRRVICTEGEPRVSKGAAMLHRKLAALTQRGS